MMGDEFSLHCAAILFDFDGVLVDSAACIERTWHRWSVDHKLDPSQVIETAHGRRTIETLQLVAPHLNAEQEIAALAEIESNTMEGVFEVPGAHALIQRLPPTSWAVVTSGLRRIATRRLRHVGLPIPGVLVCADDLQRGKPDPEGYLAAAALLGVAAAGCVVIEDAPAGIAAGRAAGMRTIAVRGTYGREALAAADYGVSHLAALQVGLFDGTLLEVRAVTAP